MRDPRRGCFAATSRREVTHLRFETEFPAGRANVTDAQMLQTREILFNPSEPEVGEVVSIKARVHNWSHVPTPAPVEVRFYAGDPAAGGMPIVGINGETSVFAPQLTDRGSAVVQMEWEVPSGLGFFPRTYAVIDPLGAL